MLFWIYVASLCLPAGGLCARQAMAHHPRRDLSRTVPVKAAALEKCTALGSLVQVHNCPFVVIYAPRPDHMLVLEVAGYQVEVPSRGSCVLRSLAAEANCCPRISCCAASSALDTVPWQAGQDSARTEHMDISLVAFCKKSCLEGC